MHGLRRVDVCSLNPLRREVVNQEKVIRNGFKPVLIGVIGICVLGYVVLQITKRFSSLDIEMICRKNDLDQYK